MSSGSKPWTGSFLNKVQSLWSYSSGEQGLWLGPCHCLSESAVKLVPEITNFLRSLTDTA